MFSLSKFLQTFQKDIKDFVSKHKIDFSILNDMLFNEVTNKKIWNLTDALFNYRDILNNSIQNMTIKNHTNDLVAVIGGYGRQKSEVLDFSGRNRMCDVTKVVSRDGIGGGFNDQIVICGGDSNMDGILIS